MKYIIRKKIDGQWVNQKQLGLFDSVDDANEKIYNLIKNKSDFWVHYIVIPIE